MVGGSCGGGGGGRGGIGYDDSALMVMGMDGGHGDGGGSDGDGGSDGGASRGTYATLALFVILRR